MPKNIVLCLDGTWNIPTPSFFSDITNVKKIYDFLVKDQSQITYYLSGVGTTLGYRLLGGIAGYGIDQKIEEGYRFLAKHYEDGDQIFLFGFSRGAYTARSIAGLIGKCGLLHQKHVDRQYQMAYKKYRSTGLKTTDQEMIDFRHQYSREINIHFIGVWDTVGELGVPTPPNKDIKFNQKFKFHDQNLGRHIKHAYHAVAIDEHRPYFEATLWQPPFAPDQEVQQVWFAGAHADVGGGYKKSKTSWIALYWMVHHAGIKGLRFRNERILYPHQIDQMLLHHEKINDSFSFFYHLVNHDRNLRKIDCKSQIDDSVFKRCQSPRHKPKYRPKNLEQHPSYSHLFP